MVRLGVDRKLSSQLGYSAFSVPPEMRDGERGTWTRNRERGTGNMEPDRGTRNSSEDLGPWNGTMDLGPWTLDLEHGLRTSDRVSVFYSACLCSGAIGYSAPAKTHGPYWYQPYEPCCPPSKQPRVNFADSTALEDQHQHVQQAGHSGRPGLNPLAQETARTGTPMTT